MIAFEKKCWPTEFEGIRLGAKPVDVRRGDFEGYPGDMVIMKEWQPATIEPDSKPGHYTGREMTCLIGYQLRTSQSPPEWNLPGGLCVSALQVLEARDAEGKVE